MTKVVYAIGDIHGRKDLLVALRKLIVADAKKNGFEDKTIVYLGDYIDRGPDSQGVIDLLMNKPLEGFNNICLKGNHEEMMFKAVEYSTRATHSSIQSWRDMWVLNGGVPTLKSYGVQPNPVTEWTGAEDLFDWDEIEEALPKEHIYWMKALPNYYLDGDYLFVHAGIQPGVPLDKQEPKTLLWIRNTFLDSIEDHGYKVIHGHSTTRSEVDFKFNRINIDTGAVWRGVQHALALHDGQERVIKTPPLGKLNEMEQRK